MEISRRRIIQSGLAVGAGLTGVTAAATPVGAEPVRPSAWETVIGPGTFDDLAALTASWNFLYPWGTDHNGSARMYSEQIALPSPGVLRLRATRIHSDEGSSSHPPHLPIRYHSGTIHAKQHVTVDAAHPQWEVKGQFRAPSRRGTWPAFWLTGVNGWPPESDILEYKGTRENWFNTYDGGWESTIVRVSDPGAWHEYRAWLAMVNDTDVDIHYYLDGNWVGQHRGSNFVGEPFYIIINLQMEGSSSEPGPGGDTDYFARNIYVGRSTA